MSAYEVNEGQSFNKFNAGEKFKTPVVENGTTIITDTEADAAAVQGLVTKLGEKKELKTKEEAEEAEAKAAKEAEAKTKKEEEKEEEKSPFKRR